MGLVSYLAHSKDGINLSCCNIQGRLALWWVFIRDVIPLQWLCSSPWLQDEAPWAGFRGGEPTHAISLS